jgi:hypothetical protein
LQEKEHLAAFNSFIPQYRARPTALLPFWHVAGGSLLNTYIDIKDDVELLKKKWLIISSLIVD